MLHEFLAAQRAEPIERRRFELANRRAPDAPDAELEHGISLCIDQLSKTLRVEQTSEPMRSREISGPAGGGQPVLSEIGGTAPQHGRALLQHSFTIDQAVTEYAYRHDVLLAEKGVRALNERLGSLAHELRNLIHTASLALTAIKAGQVGLSRATGAALDRKPDRTAHSHRSLARRRTPERRDADRESLIPAVGNLLQNAFKFTRAHSEVSLNAYPARAASSPSTCRGTRCRIQRPWLSKQPIRAAQEGRPATTRRRLRCRRRWKPQSNGPVSGS